MDSEKFAEGLRREAGILDNPTHRDRVHGIVPGGGHDPHAARHDDVLALPGDVEADLFEGLDGAEVWDPWYLRHALGWDLHFPQILPAGELFGDFDVFANRVLNVCQNLVFSGALRLAPRETRARDAVPFFGLHQGNWVFHTSDCSAPPPRVMMVRRK